VAQSPPARLAVLIPFLGYVILFQDDVARLLSFEVKGRSVCVTWWCITAIKRLYLIYFGLTFVGLASFLYLLACPKIISG
jgi:hypothetical protein